MLDSFFSPHSVALVGASREPQKLGYRILECIVSGGFAGNIYPVNPKANEVLGLRCYRSIQELPEIPELAVIVVPAEPALKVMEECGQKGIKSTIIISAGFKEAGEKGKNREAQLIEIIKKHSIRVIGPNCLGVIDTYTNLNVSFAPFMPDKGQIAFISQSGALITAVLDLARKERIGFSRVISVGNMADVSESELIEACAADKNTKVILLYLEGVKNGNEFIRRVSRVTKEKPVIAIKAGLTSSGSKAVSSHTGSLAGLSEAYAAAFRKAGVLQVSNMEELFDLALVFAHQPIIAGDRIAIITNAGGPSVVATDSAEKQGLKMAQLATDTVQTLKANLPPAANTSNPVDVLGDATESGYAIAFDAVFKDPNVDGILTILTPQVVTRPIETAAKLTECSSAHKKTVVTSFMGGPMVEQAVNNLRKNGIPNYDFPERAIGALRAMVSFNNMKKRREPEYRRFPANTSTIKDIFSSSRNSGIKALPDFQARGVFEAYGIMGPKRKIAQDIENATRYADEIGYPVVAKIASPDILHKTEAGGVKIGIKNSEQLRKAFSDIMLSAKNYNPSARINGIELQEMVSGIQEVIIGIKKDAQFGHLLMFGLGGIFVELLKDVVFSIVPVGIEEAREMISGIKGAKLLNGYRNLPPCDIDALVEAILKVSQLCEDYPEISELDINPLVVKEKNNGVVMVDARIVLD